MSQKSLIEKMPQNSWWAKNVKNIGMALPFVHTHTMTSTQPWVNSLHHAIEQLQTNVALKLNIANPDTPEKVTLHFQLTKQHCNANDLKAQFLTLPHARDKLRLLADRRFKMQAPPGYVVTYEDRLDALQRFGALTPPVRVTDRYIQKKRKRLLRWIRSYDVFLCGNDFIPPSDVELFHELATAHGRSYRIVSKVDIVVQTWLQTRRRRTFLNPNLTLCRRNIRVVIDATEAPTVLHLLRRINQHCPTLNVQHSALAKRAPHESGESWLRRAICVKRRLKQSDIYADILILYRTGEDVQPPAKVLQVVARHSKTKVVFFDMRTKEATRESTNVLRDVMLYFRTQTLSPQYRPHVTATLGTTTMSTKELVDNAHTILERMYSRMSVLGWSKKMTMRVSATQSGSVNVLLK